jgi:hypothetical protein
MKPKLLLKLSADTNQVLMHSPSHPFNGEGGLGDELTGIGAADAHA